MNVCDSPVKANNVDEADKRLKPLLCSLAKASVICPVLGWFLFVGCWPWGFLGLKSFIDLLREKKWAGIPLSNLDLPDVFILSLICGFVFLLISGPLLGGLALIQIKFTQKELKGIWLAGVGILSIIPILLLGWYVWNSLWFNPSR